MQLEGKSIMNYNILFYQEIAPRHWDSKEQGLIQEIFLQGRDIKTYNISQKSSTGLFAGA